MATGNAFTTENYHCKPLVTDVIVIQQMESKNQSN